jgi:hypothetical protein
MTSPFERLRQTINNIKVEYVATDYISTDTIQPQRQQQGAMSDGGCCCHNHESQPEPIKNNYFTE